MDIYILLVVMDKASVERLAHIHGSISTSNNNRRHLNTKKAEQVKNY